MRIQPVPLPSTLPTENAIKSWNQTRINYDPEFWGLEYEGYRYLERVPTDKLEKRYIDIIRNLVRIVSRDRDVIPINSFLSSWYWYRKEFQTRLEFHFRGATPPINPPEGIPNNNGGDAPERPKFPSSCDVLFRFDESRHVVPFVKNGSVRIGLASRHKSGMPSDPRTDDELRKHSFMPGKYSKITTKSGNNIPIFGDIKYTMSSNDYYDLCMTCGYHKELFSDFKVDACIVILKPEIFAERISKTAKRHLHDFDFFHGPIQYYDPFNIGQNELINTFMSKDFSFAYQMEYRFIWFSEKNTVTDNYILLNIGSIEDISYLYKL